jgi:TolB-like protein
MKYSIALVMSLLPAVAWPAQPEADKRPTIAVMEFRAKGGMNQDKADALGEMLATAIQDLGTYQVIAKSDIEAMLGLEKMKDAVGCDDASCLAQIGGALGAKYLVTGSLTPMGSQYLILVRLIEPTTAKVERISPRVDGSDEALMDAVPLMVAELFHVTPPKNLATTLRTQRLSRTRTAVPAPAAEPTAPAASAAPARADAGELAAAQNLLGEEHKRTTEEYFNEYGWLPAEQKKDGFLPFLRGRYANLVEQGNIALAVGVGFSLVALGGGALVVMDRDARGGMFKAGAVIFLAAGILGASAIIAGVDTIQTFGDGMKKIDGARRAGAPAAADDAFARRDLGVQAPCRGLGLAFQF